MSSDPPTALDILIADDHPLIGEALVMLIGSHFPGARVRLACDYASSLAAVGDSLPDLALVDADMPDATPAAGMAAFIRAAPGTRLIVISGMRDAALAADMLEMGAAGFLHKTSTPSTILAAIDHVLAGGRFCSEPMALTSAPRPPG